MRWPSGHTLHSLIVQCYVEPHADGWRLASPLKVRAPSSVALGFSRNLLEAAAGSYGGVDAVDGSEVGTYGDATGANGDKAVEEPPPPPSQSGSNVAPPDVAVKTDPTGYHKKFTDWTACSQACGGEGVKTRTASCVASNGALANLSAPHRYALHTNRNLPTALWSLRVTSGPRCDHLCIAQVERLGRRMPCTLQ